MTLSSPLPQMSGTVMFLIEELLSCNASNRGAL